MKAVLDLKDFCTKGWNTDEKDYNELFYRYNIVSDNNTPRQTITSFGSLQYASQESEEACFDL